MFLVAKQSTRYVGVKQIMEQHHTKQWENVWKTVAMFVPAQTYRRIRDQSTLQNYEYDRKQFEYAIFGLTAGMRYRDLYVFFHNMQQIEIVAVDNQSTHKTTINMQFEQTIDFAFDVVFSIFNTSQIDCKLNATVADVIPHLSKNLNGWSPISHKQYTEMHDLYVAYNIKNTLLLAIYDKFRIMDYDKNVVLNNVDLVFANDFIMVKIIAY